MIRAHQEKGGAGRIVNGRFLMAYNNISHSDVPSKLYKDSFKQKAGKGFRSRQR
jgi:hypothetical protein